MLSVKSVDANKMIKTLDELPVGTEFKIIGYSAGRCLRERIEHLINPEKPIKVIGKKSGPVIIKQEGNSIYAIGQGMARKIYVEEYLK